jgi:signal transduction histidine kinase
MIEVTTAGVGRDAWAELRARYQEYKARASEAEPANAVELSDREDELIDWLEDHGVERAWEHASTLAMGGIRTEDLEDLEKVVDRSAVDEVVRWLCEALAVSGLADTITSSARAISDLVNVVKSYSHMDRAPVQDIDIHDGLEDTLKILGHKLRQGIEVSRDYDRNIPPICTFGTELNQVWTNLMDNAIGAMGGTGRLAIRTHREGDFAVVEITDSGPGIPPEIQGKIFDPFFTTKDVGEGTGLGLDVVRRIVTQRCGGKIDVDSQPGRSTFSVWVPHGGSDEVHANDTEASHPLARD